MTTSPLIAFWISTKVEFKHLIRMLYLSTSCILKISKESGFSPNLKFKGGQICFSIYCANLIAISSGVSPAPLALPVLGEICYKVSMNNLTMVY